MPLTANNRLWITVNNLNKVIDWKAETNKKIPRVGSLIGNLFYKMVAVVSVNAGKTSCQLFQLSIENTPRKSAIAVFTRIEELIAIS